MGFPKTRQSALPECQRKEGALMPAHPHHEKPRSGRPDTPVPATPVHPPELNGSLPAIDCMPCPVIVADASGAIQYVNPCGVATFGFAASEMVGHPMAAFWAVASSQWPVIVDQLRQSGFPEQPQHRFR